MKSKIKAFFSSSVIDRLIVIIPITVFGVWAFGTRVLTLVILSAAVSSGLDFACAAITKKPESFLNGESLIIGLLLPLCFPASAPLWMVALADFIAIVPVKRFLNSNGIISLSPCITAMAVIYAIFPAAMMTFGAFGTKYSFSDFSPSVVPAKTELDILAEGTVPENSLFDFLFGSRTGTIGEICVALIIIAFIWLVSKKLISADIPIAYAVVLFAISYLKPNLLMASDLIALQYAACRLLCGSTAFVVVFFGSEPGTAPKTSRGRMIVGAVGGAAAYLCTKYLSAYVAPVFSVLLMNLLSYPADLILRPGNIFGGKIKKS